MHDAALTDWLKNFGATLRDRDAAGIASLFSESCTYFADPFQAPLHGQSDIAREFSRQFASRRAVSFASSLICVKDLEAWSHWTCTFTRDGLDDPVRQEGILKFSLDAEYKCVDFRQWWHSLEPGQGDLMRDFDA